MPQKKSKKTSYLKRFLSADPNIKIFGLNFNIPWFGGVFPSILREEDKAWERLPIPTDDGGDPNLLRIPASLFASSFVMVIWGDIFIGFEEGSLASKLLRLRSSELNGDKGALIFIIWDNESSGLGVNLQEKTISVLKKRKKKIPRPEEDASPSPKIRLDSFPSTI